MKTQIAIAALIGATSYADASETLSLKVNEIAKYPGYTGSINVTVSEPIQITFEGETVKLVGKLSGLEKDTSGGFHIHTGASCDDSNLVGPHYWEGDFEDPWTSQWTSDANGDATLSLTVPMYVAEAQRATMGRTVVVHAAAGTKVGCGVIEVESSDSFTSGVLSGYPGEVFNADYPAIAKMGKYPGGNDVFPTGKVTLSSDNVLTYDLAGLTANAEHGFHIHVGTSCQENTGGHYWDSSVSDPWNTTITADADGNAKGTLDVNSLAGAYSFEENVNHAIVLHAAAPNAGTRIGCGVLARVNLDKIQGFVIGYAGSTGGVVVEGWADDVQGTNGELMGAHVHEGTSCSKSEGHLFDENNVDPWLETFAEVNVTQQLTSTRARTYFKFSVSSFKFEDIADRTFVIHDTAGRRVACAKLSETSPAPEGTSSPTTSQPSSAPGVLTATASLVLMSVWMFLL